MNIRDLKAHLEGTVLQTSLRSLSEKEMASVTGGIEIVPIDGDDPNIGKTPSCSVINGCCCVDDCHD